MSTDHDGIRDLVDEPVRSLADYDEDDDHWQRYKDDVAMGYIDRDGNDLDPPEPDWEERGGDR